MSKIMYGGIAYGNSVDKDYGWTDLTGTLVAGETTLTIQHEIITPYVTITPHSDPYGVNPKDMVVTNGQVVLTFNAQPNDVGIMVRVSKTNTSVEFTKTSILDKTQMTNIVLTTDYTDYPFLLFTFDVAWDNSHLEALVPTDIITEAFNHSLMLGFPCVGDNAHVRYSKVSNTQFNRYDGTNQISLADVFGVNVNKSFTTDVIYSRGSGGESEVSISHDNILDNDLIFFSGCWNADADFANNFIWNKANANDVITQYNGTVIRRGNSVRSITITNTTMSSAIYYMVLGIKFT